MKQTRKLFCILTVMVIGIGLIPGISAEKIFCGENIDFEKFPICNYQPEWNESEKFNEELVKLLGERESEINSDLDAEINDQIQKKLDEYRKNYLEIYREVYKTVDHENPGLKEQEKQLKQLIYKQLGE